MRAMWRASKSASKLARAPIFNAPKFVDSNVCGITWTENEFVSASFTVNDTPETTTEPLRDNKPRNSVGNENRIRRPPAPSSSDSKTSPVPST